jgi:hypothetical protein
MQDGSKVVLNVFEYNELLVSCIQSQWWRIESRETKKKSVGHYIQLSRDMC